MGLLAALMKDGGLTVSKVEEHCYSNAESSRNAVVREVHEDWVKGGVDHPHSQHQKKAKHVQVDVAVSEGVREGGRGGGDEGDCLTRNFSIATAKQHVS